MNTSLRSQKGFTLLEAMIALLVLSVGLLGLAALQARSMQFTHDSLVRSQATTMASEIMDKIRSRAYDLIGANAEDTIEGYLDTNAAATVGDCPADIATAVSVMQEKGCWLQSLSRALPAGTGTITGGTNDGNPINDVYQITIRWTDRRTGNTTSQIFAFQP